MRSPRTYLLAFFALAVFTHGLSVGQAFAIEADRKPDQLVLALIPERNINDQRNRYRGLLDLLSKEIKMEVKTEFLPSYAAMVQAVKKNEVDGGFFGSLCYVIARKYSDLAAIARPMKVDNSSTYSGYLFARKDSGIKQWQDMKGKRLVLVDKATTAGYLYPYMYFREAGVVDMNRFFSSVVFAGSHDASAWAVFTGEADVGACKNHVYEATAAAHSDFGQAMQLLGKSEEVPSNGLAVRRSLGENFIAGLQRFFLTLHQSSKGQAVLKSLGAVKFVETSDADYTPVYDMVRRAGMELNEATIKQLLK